MDLLADLTEPQRQAVSHDQGPLLVLAGAGSGKTRVVTRRIAWLVEQGVPPWRILAITFTNKAAQEMRNRVLELGAAEGAWVSTFHSFAARQLRRLAARMGLSPSFTILDRDDQVRLVKAALQELKLDPKQWRPRALLEEIDRAKGRLCDPELFAEQSVGYVQERTADVYRIYENLLAQRQSVDFTDLLAKLVRHLQADRESLSELQSRFSYLLVDEYQDTNWVQYRLASLLAESHGNFHATGDPDQSIYRWRGADLNNILDFENEFPGARVIKLEQNFRSSATILEAAQGLIEHNRRRKDKVLWTDKVRGAPVTVMDCRDEQDEARRVARAIADLRSAGVPLSEIAVFCRTNSLTLPVEKALFQADIPYAVVGAVAFYQRREVKDLLAYLRCLENPWDDTSLLRVINVPPRRIGRATVEKLQLQAARGNCSLFDLLTRGKLERLGRARRAVTAFGELLARLSELPKKPVAPILEKVLDETRYLEYLESAGDDLWEERVRNVEGLVGALAEFDRGRGGSLLDLLEEVALISDVDKWDARANRVSLMTLHASKGLEFDHVFMIAFEDQILPHAMSKDSDEELEEERRLCYVGFTRARKRLHLSHTRFRMRWGRTEPALVSPFLEELPSGCFRDAEPSGKRFRPRTDPDLAKPGGVRVPAPRVQAAAFQPGDRVHHEVFGAGKVLSVFGSGVRARIHVEFDKVGPKLLLQQYSRLEACDA